jgi:hypothetical protein
VGRTGRGAAVRGVHPAPVFRVALDSAVGRPALPGQARAGAVRATESAREIRVAIDGSTRLDVAVSVTDTWPGSALFADLAEASEFFRRGEP